MVDRRSVPRSGRGVARGPLRLSKLAGLSLLVCGLAAGTARAAIRYVDADAPAGGDGLGWNTAHQNPQAALAVAVVGDTIRVAAGTYMPDGGFTPVGGAHTNGSTDRLATFSLKNGVRLEGGYAGLGAAPAPDQRDLAAHPAVLSGDLAGDAATRTWPPSRAWRRAASGP